MIFLAVFGYNAIELYATAQSPGRTHYRSVHSKANAGYTAWCSVAALFPGSTCFLITNSYHTQPPEIVTIESNGVEHTLSTVE